MSPKSEQLLKEAGWEVECELPLEIRNQDLLIFQRKIFSVAIVPQAGLKSVSNEVPSVFENLEQRCYPFEHGKWSGSIIQVLADNEQQAAKIMATYAKDHGLKDQDAEQLHLSVYTSDRYATDNGIIPKTSIVHVGVQVTGSAKSFYSI